LNRPCGPPLVAFAANRGYLRALVPGRVPRGSSLMASTPSILSIPDIERLLEEKKNHLERLVEAKRLAGTGV
jgi:hypothetical protein